MENQLIGLNDAETINNIQQYILKNFSFEIPQNADGFVYFGTAIDGAPSESVPIYKIVNGIVEKSDESYGFISSTQAGKLFNDDGFTFFLKDVLKDTNISGDNFTNIYNGTDSAGNILLSDNKTTVQAFNDFFSKNYIGHLKCSNIDTLLSGDYTLNCFGRTEFKAIFENDAIKTINGIDKNVFADVFHNAPIGEEMNCVCDVIKFSEMSSLKNIFFTVSENGTVTVVSSGTEGANNLLTTLITNEKIFSSSTKSIDEIVSLCGDSLSLESRSALEILSEQGNKFLYQFLSENSDEILSAVGKETFNVGRFTLTKGNPVVETLADGTKVIIEQTDMVTAADAQKAGYTAVESTNGTVFTKEKDGFVRIFKPDTVEDGIGAVLILASTALVVNEVYNDCQQENYKDASKELMSYSGSLLGSTILAEEWRGTAVLLFVEEVLWIISLSRLLRGLRGV